MLDVKLSEDDLAALENARAFDVGFPATFLNSPAMEGLLYGDTLGNTDITLPSGASDRRAAGSSGSGAGKENAPPRPIRPRRTFNAL